MKTQCVGQNCEVQRLMRNLTYTLVIFAICGCSQPEGPEVTSSFKPPSIDRLDEVDVADCKYNDRIVEIEGVVSPSSQGGWPRSADYSVHCFSFAAWRRPGQALVQKELLVLRPVPQKGDWFSEYPERSLHRIKVLLSTDETRAVFAGKSATAPETSQLDKIAEELSRPVIVHTERFGDLTLDRSIGWFEGEVAWNGKPVRISFETDDSQDLTEGLKVAAKLCEDQSAWKTRIDDFAVQELLSIKNDNWLGDNEAPLTPDQFKSKMTLESISVHPDGSFEFWHDDGDLFWGHSIQISGSLDEGLTHADIPG